MELTEQVARMDERLKTLEADMVEIKATLQGIDTKLSGRPSWPVAVYITLTTSAVVGLLVALISTSR